MKHIKKFRESFDLEFFGFDISRLNEITIMWELLTKEKDPDQDWGGRTLRNKNEYNLIYVSGLKIGNGEYMQDGDTRVDLQSALQGYLTTIPGMTWDKFQGICNDSGFKAISLRNNRTGFIMCLKNQEIVDFFDMIQKLK